MTKVVLVGVDGSESSLRAARRAAELAYAMGAALHVMMAADRSAVSKDAAEQTAQRAANALTSIVANVTSSPIEGKPALALVEEADRLGADLIVVGNRGAQGIGRVLGSVASAVVAHAPCDVLVVKTT